MTAAEDTCSSDGCSCCAAPVSPLLLAPANERNLRRWAWALAALTIGWNSLEAVIAYRERSHRWLRSHWWASKLGLGGRGQQRAHYCLAIAQADDRSPRQRTRRAPRCTPDREQDFIGIAVYVTYDAALKSARVWGTTGAQPGRTRPRCALGSRHAHIGVGQAARRGSARLSGAAGRCCADQSVHLPLGGGPAWTGRERPGWLVVDGPARGASSGRSCRERRNRRLAQRRSCAPAKRRSRIARRSTMPTQRCRDIGCAADATSRGNDGMVEVCALVLGVDRVPRC